MSRIGRTLIDQFSQDREAIPMFKLMEQVTYALKAAHGSDDIYLKVSFKYPILEKAPVSEEPSYEVVDVILESTLRDSHYRHYITVKAVGMSLCPCSKEMSLLINNLTPDERRILEQLNLNRSKDAEHSLYKKIIASGFGAHNQKSYISVKVEPYVDSLNRISIKDLLYIINESVSCPTSSILKRPDEKYVTEVSYMGSYIDEDGTVVEVPGTGPKFVEDISRQIANRLIMRELNRSIDDYAIVVSNEESIHSSDIEAVAVLIAGRDLT